jgi:hypothetical protein
MEEELQTCDQSLGPGLLPVVSLHPPPLSGARYLFLPVFDINDFLAVGSLWSCLRTRKMSLKTEKKLALPDEILLLVFAHVEDIRDVLRCRQVCTILSFLGHDSQTNTIQLSTSTRKLIDQDTAMQYQISLALSNLDDGPPGRKSSAERLEILRKWQEGWSTLSWSESDLRIKQSAGGFWELHGK